MCIHSVVTFYSTTVYCIVHNYNPLLFVLYCAITKSLSYTKCGSLAID